MKTFLKDNMKILVVDDQEYNVDLLKRILARDGYANLQGITDPSQLETVFCQFNPDILLLDIHMPSVDGIQVLEMMRGWLPADDYLPVLILTADVSPETKQRALSMGAHDFLSKPFDRNEVLLRIRNLLQTRQLHQQLKANNQLLEEKVQERTIRLEQSQMEVLNLLARMSEFRDDLTGKHTQRVGELSGRIAREVGLPEEECLLIEQAAPLHDIGKIGVPDGILLKPDALTAEEYEVIKKHTVIGERILQGSLFSVLRMAETIALTHHEKWDGTGYPNGLCGDSIPIGGRIVALADFFDALTHERPYKRAWTVEETLAEIDRQSGKHFDPDIAAACIRVIRAAYTGQLLASEVSV